MFQKIKNIFKIISAMSNSNFENISAGEFKAKIEADANTVVLDVRMKEELEGGFIKNSINLNIMSSSFVEEIKKLDKSKTYLIYCRSGNRSAKACGFMANEGFKDLYNLIGGYGAW